jgi:peptidoglycan/LPS O-acetylase OafA/YrhL
LLNHQRLKNGSGRVLLEAADVGDVAFAASFCLDRAVHDAPARSRFLAHFSRVTTRGTFIPEVDGLRFVAIAAVLVFHLALNLASRNPVDFAYPDPGSALHDVIRTGELGVQLFFILSGLVLALPFARHHLRGGPRVRLKAYFLRRLTRLEPPYFVVMIGCFLLLVVVHGRSLGYVHDLVYGRDSLINNVAWSLEVEIQFYLLVPWLTALLAISRPVARRAVLVSAIVLTSALGPLAAGTSPHLHNTLLRFAQYFLVGFLLADLMVSDQLRPTRWLPGPSAWLLGELVVPWLCLVAYLGVFRGVVLNAVLTLPLVTTVGGMCYSIYLLHNVILNNTLFVTKDLAPTGAYGVDLALQLLIMGPFVVAVSAVFFVLVERPCMDKDWPRHLAAWVRVRLGRTRSPG